MLDRYTKSGRTIVVPTLVGHVPSEIREYLANSELDIEVIDSLYIPGERPGAIVDQIPDGGKKVKKGRKIYVTINAYTKEMTVVPQLVNFSYRNAQVNLQNAGLRLGEVIRVPSPYTDLVLEQKVGGADVKSGAKIPKGTAVDIVVGIGDGGGVSYVPSLAGKSLSEARQAIVDARFYVGKVEFDETVRSPEDTVRAVVYRQYPSPSFDVPTEAWIQVNLWMTTNIDKALDSVIEQE